MELSMETDMKESTNCKLSSGMTIEDMNISNLVKDCNLEVQSMDNKKEEVLPQESKNTEASKTASSIVKAEVKSELMDHHAFEDSYDEIEQKLKQICDGASTEDETYKKRDKMNLDTKDQKKDKVEEKIHSSSEFVKNDNEGTALVNDSHNLPVVDKVVDTIKVKEETVETIFGIESADEKVPVPSNILKTDKNEVECEKDKVFNDDIEENFTKDEVHVIPNIRAAMKRKKRTREEIMKSIKRSIKSTAGEDVNSCSDNDSSEEDIEIGNGLFLMNEKLNDPIKNDTESETAKFVIKVTGDPDDVSEIIEELSSTNSVRTEAARKFSTISMYKENDSLVTSVITIQSPKNPKEINYMEIDSPITKDNFLISRKSMSPMDYSPYEKNEVTSPNAVHSFRICDSLDLKHIGSDEDEKYRTRIDSPFQSCMHGQTSLENNSVNVPSDYEDLLERIQIQDDVIAKLTDQLIIHKEMENRMRNRLKESKIEASKINTRSSNVQTTLLGRRSLECKQRLIDDLSNRVNYLEEVNKKLMKTVTLESQQKRKLEGQIKQKDNRIKELNWKLEKASKYLERAEKNTNTYKRKMLNMQTTLRRRKLLDEKMSRFNEMLIDNSKQEFSEKVLVTAADIKKVCGKDGYEKLLSYGFPLPPLTALKGDAVNEDFTDLNNSDIDEVQNSTKLTVKTDKTYDTTNESEIDGKNRDKGTEYEGAETVTGTVQDIFDENNEGDDFGTNELREHFILQLHAVM